MTDRQTHPYIDLSVTITGDDDLGTRHDAAVFYLSEAGYGTFSDDDLGTLHAFIEKSAYDEQKTAEALAPLGSCVTTRANEIEDRDWNEEWEKNYHRPIEAVPGRVVIRASFHEARPDVPFDIVIDPKMAFGTGNHATTAGMIRLIDGLPLAGRSVIDMGCGSGVLGIFAMKKGASCCTSIDIDDRSTANARENADANGVDLDIRHGDASLLPSVRPADYFFANITRNIILEDLDRYLSALKPDGTLLLSGFLLGDLPTLTRALSERGLETKETLNPEGDWVALRAERR